MKRLLSTACTALFLLVPALALAADRPRLMPDPVTHIEQGPIVRPHSIEFTSLPRVSAFPYVGPQKEVHDEGVWEEAEQDLQAQKANPRGVDLRALGSHVTLDATSSGGGLTPLAPTLGTGFEGITQGPYIPSEPTVAAGPLNIFSAGNVNVTVTNKDGSNRVETDGATFFGVPVAEGAISDAQCYYDAVHGRFVAVAFTQGTSPSNYSNFYLLISKTNDARGAWWQYKFDMTKDGSTSTANWSDYESLGLTEDKIVLTAQQFTFAADAYVYPKIRVLDRAALFSGAAASYVDFVNFAAPTGGDTFDTFVTKCARNLTPGDAVGHLLCVRVNGGTNVTYREVTGPPASPSLSAGTKVTVATYTAPPDAVQKGSATLVPTNDCRPGDFVARNGVLVATWHFGTTISATSVSAVRLFRMRTSDLTVLTDETFGAASTFYYYPAATVDSAGTVYLGFGRSSSTEYPSAYVTGRRPSDASIEPSVLTKAGLSATSQSRWGDYTGIDNDASLSGPGGTSAWYAGQWTKAANSFGTWINTMSFTYGQIGGSVVEDCDGNAGTTGDRAPRAGVTLTLFSGASPVATTTSDGSGNYNFGYLEAGTYDVVVTPPAGGGAVDAIAGTGGTSQVRVGANDLQATVTITSVSTGNQFVVSANHAAPVATTISPNFKVVGDPGFTLTVNGSGFTSCSTVRVDGADRTTTFVNGTQLTAAIPAGDLAVGGARAVTVFTPTPGGGTSAPVYLTVSATPDTQAPTVAVTSPAGGENWAVGSAHAITWTATDDHVVASVDLALSIDGGATFPTAIATGIANSGSFAWTVPYTLTSTARVRVVAHDGVGNLGADSSHTNVTFAGWTVTASAGAGGAIAPSGVQVVADGATPAYTITPSVGYHVQDVLVNGGSVGAVTAYTFAAIHADQTISASFAIDSYTLTVNTSGSGTVAKSPDQPSYPYGTLVTLTATPAGGWNFVGWSGDTSATTNPLTFAMRANRTITATFGQHTYVWSASGTASWATASNWTPARTTPATDDVLIFNSGTSVTATTITSQTIGQLVIANNTTVALQSGVAAVLTLAGGAGTDFDLQAGSTLLMNGTSALSIALPTGSTGSVSGAITATTNAHRLLSVDAGGLVFKSGSVLTLGTGFSGNVFGTGTGTSGLNSVVFQAGALLSQSAGANPFGANAPNSAVVFQAGSRYRLNGAITPSMAGRTYADFEYNNNSVISTTGTSGCTVDSLIVSVGTFNLNMTGSSTVRGSIRVNSGATLTFTPASGTPVISLAGTTPQQVAIFGSFSMAVIAGVAINNPSGVTLATNWTLAAPVTFTSGKLTTGANTLILSSTSNVTGASEATGWVAGNLRRNVVSGTSTRVFDIGDASHYTPVTLAVNGATTAFDLTAATTTGDHPNLASSDLDGSKSANRWWSLVPVGAPTFTNFDGTFAFNAADVDGGANTANFLVRRYSGGWTSPVTGTRTATSTQATGLTAFGEFAVGEKLAWTITASAGANGSIAPSGAVSVNPGASQAFTITPDANYHVADVLVDGASVGAVTGYTFNAVSANHTIAASFAGDARTLTVGTTGTGTVAKSPDLATYPYGSTVQLTATPGSGWAFLSWSGDLTGGANPANLLMDASKSVTAAFADTAAPVVTVTAPNGGEVLSSGSNTSITWTAADNASVASITLRLSRNGLAGPFDTLAAGLANTGSWSWAVSVPVTADARVEAIARDAAGNAGSDVSDASFSITSATGVDDAPVTAFALGAPRPNPARGMVSSTFAVPREARIRVGLLDVQGREVMILAAGEFAPGRHAITFGGERLTAGVYFLRMQVRGGPTFTQRLAITH